MMPRLFRAITSAFITALVVLIAYVVVDLYRSGRGKGWTPEQGDPWYYHLFTVLVILAPLAVGTITYRRR